MNLLLKKFFNANNENKIILNEYLAIKFNLTINLFISELKNSFKIKDINISNINEKINLIKLLDKNEVSFPEEISLINIPISGTIKLHLSFHNNSYLLNALPIIYFNGNLIKGTEQVNIKQLNRAK